MIIVFGSINLDQIATVPRLPGPGETVAGSGFAVAPGGKGANQALAARRAGRDVRLVGAVGRDVFAETALELLREDGVDLSALRTVDGPTGVALILVDATGENVIAVVPGANAALGPDDAEAALASVGRGSILMLQGEVPVAANRRALELARAQGVTSIFNTAPFDEATAELAALASVVIANESEFARLTGGRGAAIEPAMRDWARTHGQAIVVTTGDDGARVCNGAGVFHIHAPAVEVVDTVGAGDTFCGYLAAGLDAGFGLEAAVARATVAASLACRARGAQPAIPTASEVEAFGR